ncbi:MAG: carboxypeptidase M32 [Deltaproteobacteria bacterium]|jgi:carboxypeptidase Taq|nr:carboxypeptidase M32 [Deltaproteobacteria bacterium]
MKKIDELHLKARELTDLNSILALLQWDQEVMLPHGGSEGRAGQISVLSSIVHRKITAPALGEILAELSEKPEELSAADLALIRVMKREYDKNTKLPEKFVAEFSRLVSQALPVWVEARKKNGFGLFLPLLEKIISMSRQKADLLGYEEHPYDALLDLYEEGLTVSELDPLFTDLKDNLSQLLRRKLSQQQKPIPDITAGMPPMSVRDQVRFSEKILQEIGYDFNRGRQDISAHPFTTSLGHNDRRVTNRFRPDSLEFIFSALHEGGHALYEQNIAGEYAETPLDEGVSLGIHESQSRLWENIIGRSYQFWEKYYPLLQELLPDQFRDVPLDDFVVYINKVHPGLIRVEADEVSYNLHVLIRFELEKGVLEGAFAAASLPALWNEKYKEYLDVDVDSDANGALQDIHWAHGSFGYFPTYTIGNLAAAQIWHKYCLFDPDYRQTLVQGKLDRIRNWLTENIYRYGALYTPAELLEKVCGEPLNSMFFIEYLKNKPEFSL